MLSIAVAAVTNASVSVRVLSSTSRAIISKLKFGMRAADAQSTTCWCFASRGPWRARHS